jgi:carboxyl-terminal processing protease
MVGVATLGLLLVATASPVPPPPQPAGVPNVDRGQANSFAHTVYSLAEQLSRRYARPVAVKDLVEAAIRGMYEEAGQGLPDDVRAAVQRAENPGDQLTLLADARIVLGKSPAMEGTNALFAAMNGFRHATDANCQLASPRVNSFASVDMDFGIGIELDGATAARWAIFQADHAFATGRFPVVGGIHPVPTRETLQSPAVLPWRVKRVIPGSPAQKVGLKPGDVLTHLNGKEVTAESASKLFTEMAFPFVPFDPNTGRMGVVKRTFTVRRGTAEPFPVALSSDSYAPESIQGVLRIDGERWDGMLDREFKIGYARVGPVEDGCHEKLHAIMDDLTSRGARAMILDLRWCPGGYITPAAHIAGMFLNEGVVITRINFRNPGESSTPPVLTNPYPAGGKFTKIPLLVLVGSETTGGGELIAAALQDAGRCVVMGQRTVGRATIQNVTDAGFGGVQFKFSTGTSLRPNGKPRQKLASSLPTDEWGIRPDPGLEVPITLDLSIELRQAAELHALRPAESRDALPFDDPQRDPYRAAALRYYRDKLGKPEPRK